MQWFMIMFLMTPQFETIAFFAVSQNKLRLHKQNIYFYQLLNGIMKIKLQYSKIL